MSVRSDVNEVRIVEKMRTFLPGLRLIWRYTLSPVDAYSITDMVVVEIKVRNKHYNDLVLEETKLKSMQEIAHTYGMRALYVCETPLGMWYWDITNLSPEWTYRKLPYSTDDGRAPAEKKITYVSIDTATKIV